MGNDIALLMLRLTGLYMALAHGWGKVFALATGDGSKFVEGVAALGFPAPLAFAWAAALAEFAGGLAVAFGLYTRLAAGSAAFTMAVAGFLRHHAHEQALVGVGLASRPAETVEGWGNPELALIYFLAFFAIMLLGPGGASLDRAFRGKASRGGGRR